MKKRKAFGVLFILLVVLVAILWIRGKGVGYIESVTGINVPWPRESSEHYDCDFGQYSFVVLKVDSMAYFLAEHAWQKGPPSREVHNDQLVFRSLKSAPPLPAPEELLWLQGATKHNVWRLYLHTPTRHFWAVVEHADPSGDLPAGVPRE